LLPKPNPTITLIGFANFMNIIKTTTIVLSMAICFSVGSVTAFAEETTASQATSASETISHIEKALVEISKSDFNSAQAHLKAARLSSEKVTGNPDIIKKANANVIQAQIQAKLGDVKKSSDELNKAIALYKSL
jgi:hypothetical protein